MGIMDLSVLEFEDICLTYMHLTSKEYKICWLCVQQSVIYDAAISIIGKYPCRKMV